MGRWLSLEDREKRNKLFYRLHKIDGLTYSQIAKRCGLAIGYVGQIVRRIEERKMFEIKRIVIHHSLTKDSETVSWGAIRRYHMETLGWSDIGYHAGVELVRNDYEVLMGRMWDEAGAHTRGQNHDSLGICFIGNYDLEKPPEKMLVEGGKLIALWMKLFDILLEEIYTHHHFADYKTCPGTQFDMDELFANIPS